MTTRGRRWLGLSVVAVLALAGPVPAPAPAAAALPATVYGGRISSATVMRRAANWLRRDIAYSQDNRRARWDLGHGRRYRPDCSGFVSMAWALETRGAGRALVTWELPRVSTRIGWSRLRPGDILLRLVPENRARGHVVIFQAWVDRTRTRAWIIEQSGREFGMRRKTVTVAGVRNAFHPYRYRRIY